MATNRINTEAIGSLLATAWQPAQSAVRPVKDVTAEILRKEDFTRRQKAIHTDILIPSQEQTKSLSVTSVHVQQQPQLSPPSPTAVANSKRVVEELDHLFARIKNIDSDQDILRLIFASLQKQRESRTLGVVHATQVINAERTLQKANQKEEIELHTIVDKANKQGEIAAILNRVFGAITVGLLLLSLLAAIKFTAILGLALGLPQALVNLGTAINTGLKLEYKGIENKGLQKLERVQHDRKVSQNRVKGQLENNKQSNDQVHQSTQLQSQVARNAYRATRFD